MAYENDPYRDEDGEPLMDFDEDVQSDGDEPQQHFLDNEDDAAYDRRDRSPTPVYNDSKAKPRKRLIKKSSSGKDMGPVDFGLDDDEGGARGDYGGDEGDMAGMVRELFRWWKEEEGGRGQEENSGEEEEGGEGGEEV
ncbi:UNVERIFIED_CONTAM: protein IWS11 [Sesamum calycinum]|uniref:Protein IWS11 n=1 Tax=Sesamum calycinum TaxID=2727403 RepID=A0AAW2M157_9LAMI